MASKAKTPAKPDDPAQDPTGWPAAWLPDPHGEGELRWWNGSKWTDHVHGPASASEDEGNGDGSSDKQPTQETYPVDQTIDAAVAPEAATQVGPESPTEATNAHALKAAIDADPGSVVRVCPKCSAQGLTSGDHCPHCGASYTRRKGRLRGASRRAKLIVGGVVAVLLIGGSVTGVLLKLQHDNDVAATHKQQRQEAQRQAAAQTQAQQAIDQANQEKRTLRAGIVTSLQDSVTKDATKNVDQGLLTGPISSTSCTPVGGGSTDDLTAHTGNFSCIAVNKTNGDGTSEGYRYSATVNYDDGSYTWHLGGA
jgi:type II secretory pathway pseudopilin PulG